MRHEGPREALLNTRTAIIADRGDPVAQAISEMTADQLARLEHFARRAGLTREEAVVQIVSLVLCDEGR